MVAATSLKKSASVNLAKAASSLSMTALNGISVRHDGFCAASALMRSRVNTTSVYSGCSHHSVPSLSKVAMRSLTGTKSGLPGRVVSSTSLMIAALTGPSFQDGSGSLPPTVAQPATNSTATTSAASRVQPMNPRIRQRMRLSRSRDGRA